MGLADILSSPLVMAAVGRAQPPQQQGGGGLAQALGQRPPFFDPWHPPMSEDADGRMTALMNQGGLSAALRDQLAAAASAPYHSYTGVGPAAVQRAMPLMPGGMRGLGYGEYY